MDVEVGALYSCYRSRSSGLGLRAGAELRLRALLQELEKLPGRQERRAGAE